MRLVLIIHESVCGNPASALKNFLVFAEVLQAPISPFGHLQKFCKLHFSPFGHLQKSCKLRFSLLGLCRSPASSIFLFWAFAEVLQAPFSPFGHLQKFCKLHFSLWGLCRSSASSIFPFGVFAGMLQTFSEA